MADRANMLCLIMDRAMIEEQLAQAEGRVTRGLLVLARLDESIAGLRRGGHVAAAEHATMFLKFLQETQVQHEAHRDRLRKELKNFGDIGSDKPS